MDATSGFWNGEDLAERFERIHARNTEVSKRWNESLAFDKLVIPEDYLSGRFTVVIKLEIGPPLPSDNILYDSLECVTLQSSAADSGAECCFANRQDQKIVFVPIAEMVKCVDGIISPVGHIAVGFYPVNKQEFRLLWEGLTYQRISDGASEALPVIPYGKSPLGFFSRRRQTPDQTHPSEIQGGSQIADNITGPQDDLRWNGFGHSDLEDLARAFRIMLQRNTIGFSVDELFANRVKVHEMFCGPFDL